MAGENNSKLDKLRSKYQANLVQYRDRLAAIAPNVPEDTALLQEMQMLAHRLAGSGQAYGFRDISQTAKALEDALSKTNRMSKKEISAVISAPVHALLTCLQQHQVHQHTQAVTTDLELKALPDAINLLIVDDDDDFSAKLAHTLETYGYIVKTEANITNLEQAVSLHKPLALLVDMDFYGQRFAGSNHVSLWRQKDGAPLPVIFISEHDSFQLRLASVRAGGNYFLSKPLDIPKLITILHAELNLSPTEPYRVMVVDDDSDVVNLYQSVLDEAGYSVSTATCAERALAMLDESQPELILIDVNMPGCNGIELGRIIRQHEQFSVIPILFISANADTDVQLACARLANDEFISKPIEPWRLLMMVKSRVIKGRQLQQQDTIFTSNSSNSLPDALTALPKLAYLQFNTNKVLQQKPEALIALLKIDIRDFHSINNLHGQFCGDQVLQHLAWELGQHIKTADLLCRESGDEFYLLTTSYRSHEALHNFIKSLLNVVEKTQVFSEQGQVALSIDVGVAVANADTLNADELIDYAEMALYKAKASSAPDIVYFDGKLQNEQKHRFGLEQAIKNGLATGQFTAVYQPIFDTAKQIIVGFEALARWQHPERGLISPGEFIPLLEERGLISELTRQMLAQVALQLSHWLKLNPDLFISLNLSALDIQKPVFIEQLQSLLTQYQLPPSAIVLEITESQLLYDWQQTHTVLELLRALGTPLALDDFGTGYSSLSYLQRINADKLKIDRSFIQHWSKTGDARLLRTMVQLGQNMHMTVIAEGIEQQAELEFLRQLGCEQYQGFLTAKPMLASEIDSAGWLSLSK